MKRGGLLDSFTVTVKFVVIVNCFWLIAAGLVSVFDRATDAELGKLSKHLSGDAFDVQPVDKDAESIKKTIRGLPGLGKFLDVEGGLVRWHVQF